MQRGKRMLKAQERRRQLSDADASSPGEPSTGDGTLAGLRSERAFEADGTPNRPRRLTGSGGADGAVEVDGLPSPSPITAMSAAPAKRTKASLPTTAAAGQQQPLGAGQKRERSTTPPAQRKVSAGWRPTDPSPLRFVPPALRSVDVSSHRSQATAMTSCGGNTGGLSSPPQPLEADSATAMSAAAGGGGSRAPPRRWGTRGYPTASVTAGIVAPPSRSPARDTMEAAAFATIVSGGDGGASSAATLLSAPPLMPPPAPHTGPHHDRSSPPLLKVQQQHRLPMPSPPLRAVVSPRMLPQYLSRTASAGSQSWGLPSQQQQQQQQQLQSSQTSQHSPRGTPPVLPNRVSPGCTLPAAEVAAGGGAAVPPRVALTNTDQEADGGVDAYPQRGFPSTPTDSSRDFLAKVSPTLNACALPSEAPPDPYPQELSQQSVEGLVSPQPQPQQHQQQAQPMGELISDASGFRNRGNDCYACSVLTLLLRGEAFRAALACAPPVQALHMLYGEKPAYVTSGYRPGRPIRAPWRRGGSCHYQDSTPATPPIPNATAAGEKCDGAVTALTVNEDGDPVPTVHEALDDLAAELWRRERVVYRVNDDLHTPVARRIAVHRRFMATFAKSKAGEEGFFRGISLEGLAAHLGGNFFAGEQEDAHELFVALMGRLEGEALSYEHRRLQLLEGESGVCCAAGNDTGVKRELAERGGDGKYDGDAQETMGVKNEGDRDLSGDPAATAPEAILPALGKAKEPTPPPVWVNDLVQGRLLNMVRCRNPACRHQIATEESFVNLAVTITRCDKPSSSPSDPRRGSRATPSAAGNLIGGEAPDPPRVSQLLFDSLQYGSLEGYVCDACGTKTRQYQGACFFQRPPPVLFVQLKRFTVHAGLNAAGDYTVTTAKDLSEVCVEGVLEVLSLPDRASDQEGGGAVYYDAASSQLGERVLAAEAAAAAAAAAASAATASQRGDSHDNSGSSDGDETLIEAVRSVYQLRGLLLHRGRELTFGHYIAQFATSTLPPAKTDSALTALTNGNVVINATSATTTAIPQERSSLTKHRSLEDIEASLPPLQWRLADDERVRQVPTEAVRESWRRCKSSYLLSYEKVHEERVRVPVWRVLPRLADDTEAEKTEEKEGKTDPDRSSGDDGIQESSGREASSAASTEGSGVSYAW